MYKIALKWEGNMNIRGFDSDGRDVLMDSSPELGGLGKGMRPTQLLLISLGGCAGLSLVNVLNKMRIVYEKFDVEVEAERDEAPPNVFTSISVKYIINSQSLTREKLERAIRIGESNCSIANMLVKACPIAFSYQLNGVSYKLADD